MIKRLAGILVRVLRFKVASFILDRDAAASNLVDLGERWLPIVALGPSGSFRFPKAHRHCMDISQLVILNSLEGNASQHRLDQRRWIKCCCCTSVAHKVLVIMISLAALAKLFCHCLRVGHELCRFHSWDHNIRIICRGSHQPILALIGGYQLDKWVPGES